MKVLFEIGHPAHVHFFMPCLRKLEAQGHEYLIVTRDKEITNALLDSSGIPYKCLSKPRKGKIFLLLELLSRWYQIAELIYRNRVDLVVSISGISTSVPAWITGTKNITFTDTEDATLTNWIAFPFSNKIYTPNFFLKHLGRKHKRYDGLHELSYLQSFDFEAAAKKRVALGFKDPYVILRIVANDALHDHKLKALSLNRLKGIIKRLSSLGQVWISSQEALPTELEEYRLDAPIEDIHAILSGAKCFVGDSPTMAVESALLGVPAYLVTSRFNRLGNMIYLEKDFGLLKNYSSWEDFVEKFEVPSGNFREKWQTNASLFRQSRPSTAGLVAKSVLSELL